MTSKEWKDWLSEEPKPEEVKLNPDNSQYIPIGMLEQVLDTFDRWGTSNFKFALLKTGGTIFASASISLDVWFDNQERHHTGASTFQILQNDVNTDYEATALSLALANAAKKLGKRFGRGLNNRLLTGETALPIKQVQETHTPDQKEEQEFKELEQALKKFKTKEEAQEYLNTSGFKYHIGAKQIVNSKPSKK